MNAKHTLRAFALLTAIVVASITSEAMATCASCGGGVPAATYSAAYAAPVAYQAAYAPTYAAPTYTTAYAPVAYQPVAYQTYRPAWYPGRWLGRVNRSVWGYPTTASYAPVYTAAYAPTYTAAYAPSYSYASYASSAPACSTCTANYAAPACSTCSTCTASYAPACSSCSAETVSYVPACDACAAAGTTCASCSAGSTVSQATYVESTPVAPAPATTTYVPQTSGTTTTTTTEPQPTLDPNQNIPGERTMQKADKPAPADPPLQPEPQADATDDSATNIQAPQLFDPNDRTAQRHQAPVWTAVYHKTSGSEPKTQTVSLSIQQVESDAAGWTSATE